MSISNTRLSSRAQLMRAGFSAGCLPFNRVEQRIHRELTRPAAQSPSSFCDFNPVICLRACST